MPRVFGFFWIIAATLIFAAQHASAGQRVALVIGNTDYVHATSPASARRDALHVAAALDKLGYQVFRLNNLTASSFHRMVSMFANQAEGATTAIVYYAGYGIEEAGQTYLVPIDATPGVTGKSGALVSVTKLTQQLAQSGVRSTMMLDVTARNVFSNSAPTTRGLVRIGLDNTQPAIGASLAQPQSAPPAVPVLVSGKPGSGQSGLVDGHSPFAIKLVNALNEPQINLGSLTAKVKLDVASLSGNALQPYVLGTVPSGAFALNDLAHAAVTTTASPIRNSLIIQSASADYQVNDMLSIFIKAQYDCHLTLFNIDQATNSVTMVFPNKFQRDSRISARSIVQFPSADAPFQMRLPQAGEENFVALCSTQPDPFGLAGKFRGGAFTSITRSKFDALMAHARQSGEKDVLMGQIKVSVR